MIDSVVALVFFGLLTGSHRPVFEAHLGANTFPPEADTLLWCHISSGPSASRNTFSVSTITDGNARIKGRSTLSYRPDCTSSRLRAEEYDRPVTQSIATLEPSSRTIPAVSPHSGADGLVQVSCRPSHLNFDRFHQPCLLPGRTSRIGGACRFPVPRGGHLPFVGSPALPPS